MGHKVHPYGFRIGIIKPWLAKWYADRDYATLLQEDMRIRELVARQLSNASVSQVEIERGWHTAYIALGSNMGDRENYLNTAVRALDEIRGCSVRRVSHFLETPPYGVTDQADFLNGCLELKTLLPPRELLDELHRIEQGAGRERILRWGPRTLDLDIIFYDDLVWEEDGLCIPHVEMHKRKFVLEPLSEIAPYKRHPVYGKTVSELNLEL